MNHAARVAHIAKLLSTKNETIERFEGFEQIRNLNIEDHSLSKLNKLKKTNAEAFYYWYKSVSK
jgi:hypothetical protein